MGAEIYVAGGLSTVSSASRHLPAVERVIAAMRRGGDCALDLRAMSETANLSPYYFARTFGEITGSPPGEFLTALRIERAKQLLLSTDLLVAEICLEVGYESLGSFTSRFKKLVGISPGRMRRLPEELHSALDSGGTELPLPLAVDTGRGVTFEVHGPDLSDHVIFAGLFQSAIPQGRPAAGTILEAPGPCRLAPVPDGRYHLMAASLPVSRDPWKLLLPGDALRVGRARRPLEVRGGRTHERPDVELRPPRSTDPPVLVALPALLLERLEAQGGLAPMLAGTSRAR